MSAAADQPPQPAVTHVAMCGWFSVSLYCWTAAPWSLIWLSVLQTVLKNAVPVTDCERQYSS